MWAAEYHRCQLSRVLLADLSAWDPITVDALVVVRTKKDGLSFRITKLHLSAQLLECTENLQIEPTLNRSPHAKFLENLSDEELALSKCIAKSRKSSLAGFIIKQDFFV